MANDRPFGHRVILYSQTGYNLTIRKNGEILGTQDTDDVDSLIEITSGDHVSHVRLRGLNNNLYVCYTEKGELYGEVNPKTEGTIFIEEFQGSYSAYKSTLNSKWYIAINKNGSPKPGERTGYGQKAVKFLPIMRH